MVRDSSVGIATRYGLSGPGFESRRGLRFFASAQTGPGAYPASYTMGTRAFPGVKWPERGVDHPTTSSAEVKGRVELQSTPPLGLRGLFYGEPKGRRPISIPLCILENLSSNFAAESFCPEFFFFSVRSDKCCDNTAALDYVKFLPDSFQFIIPEISPTYLYRIFSSA